MKTISIIVLGILLAACNSQEETSSSEKEQSVTDTIKIEGKSSMDGQLMEVEAASELALEMRAIEKELQQIKQQINEGNPDFNWVFVPENFIDAEATDPNVKNGDFTSYTQSFHKAGQNLEQTPSIEQYELVIEACINCHEQFCTGPIKRIEKLHL